MDSDGELDIVEQAERTALQEDVVQEEDGDEETEEVQREANDDDVEEVEADGNENDDGATRTVIKPKRVVLNPQPKLNAETLRGPRGLTALPALFAKQKFKGKGHEESDLNVILQTYQYWCHRLFPKMRFDQCVEKIETLGNKKQVMTYVKRIRMGLLEEEPPELKETVVSDEETDTPTPHQQQQIETVESRFDTFAQQSKEPELELTAEQQEIIRVNKERAMKLRAERLRRIQEQAEAKLGKSGTLSSQTSETETIGNVIDESTASTSVEPGQSTNNDMQQSSMDLFGDEADIAALSSQTSGREEPQVDEEIDVDEMLNDLQSSASDSILQIKPTGIDGDKNCADNMEVDSNVHDEAS